MDSNHVEPVNQNLRLIACPHVLSIENGRIDRLMPAGGTVADHLRAIGWNPDGLHARVFIDGEMIEAARWEYAVPCAGQSVVARVIPMGGAQGKDVMKIVLQIAIIIAAMYVGAQFGPILGPIVTAAISILGTLALNGLIPQPLPRRALHQPVPQRQLQEAS